MSEVKDLITRWERVRVADIIVLDRQREVSGEHVGNLVTSYEEFGGQLQPIIVDETNVLIDGAHRLEAAKVSGWEWIDAGVARGNLSPEDRAYAEASANAVRRELSPRERLHLFETIFKPELERQARARQKAAGERRAAERWGSIASENFSEAIEPARPSRGTVAAQAQALVGLDTSTMAKLSELEDLADSENEKVARIAKGALDRIDESGMVDGEYKVAKKLAAKALAPAVDAEHAQATAAGSVIARAVNLVTLTEERLDDIGADALAAAARVDPAGDEDLAALQASLERQSELIQTARGGRVRTVLS